MFLFKRVLNNKFVGGLTFAMAVAVPALAFAASATVTANVNVRSGPGANYARLAALPAGVSVNVGSCRGSWCQIYNGNRVGFVSARYVRFGSYNGNAYAAPSNTTVIVGNDGYNDGWAPGFGLGLGLGLGWATGGGYWGPGWGGPGWRGGPNYYNGCIGRNCQSNRGGGRNGWNPRWGHGPQWGGRGWPRGQVRGNWGPGPVVGPRFTSGQGHFGGFNRPAFGNRGFGVGFSGGGMHFGNMRPMHAGR